MYHETCFGQFALECTRVVVMVMGSNGAGKITLTKTIAGLLESS